MSHRDLLTSEMFLTDDQLKAVGCLTIESARLESLLSEFIQLLCRFTDDQRNLFIGKWTTGIKIDAIKKLYRPKLRSKIRLKKFDALFNKLEILNQQRNIVVHGDWQPTQPYNALAIGLFLANRCSDAAATSKKKQLSIKATDVMTVAQGIAECRSELFRLFCSVISTRVRASLKKSPQQYRRSSRT